ncbi:hypothetical protein O1R50_11040 [Glycomyces luteolus]|uniref:Uncharacterized protein n=1 Tax=Glycomyces luteolus TaxID=2670330 RepID=A0A9X3PB88_9ACTN|nr:hypothetical protein [Glycomyces luteolus]MDA1360165.1 hypothetical protein [Glycomyces luteolus]
MIAAIGLCSTALGTILPIARGSGLLAGPVGPHLMAVGAVGEFALLALLYSEGRHPGWTSRWGRSRPGCMHALLSALDEREEALVHSKLDGIGFGAVVPVFFVYAGVTFDLDELLGSALALVLIPVFLAAFAATGLLIVVVAASTAAERGLVEESIAAAMLSVLLFPLIGLRWARMDTSAVTAEAI